MTCKNYKVPQLKWGDAMLNILTPAYWHCLKNHPQSQPGCFPGHSQNHILKPGLKKPSQPSWINYQGKSLGICPDMGPMISTVVFPRLKIVFFFLLGRLMMTHEPLVLQLAMWKIPFQLLTGQWLVPRSDVVMWNLLPSQVHPKQSG